MTWGTGSWGGTPWGTGIDLPPPLLSMVSPSIVERRGGTVLRITGQNFFDPTTVKILSAGQQVGSGYIFDAKYDLERNRIFCGLPALADGFYDVQVSHVGGDSNILTNALEYRLHADEVKVQRVRIGFAQPWVTGPRLLTNPTTGLGS